MTLVEHALKLFGSRPFSRAVSKRGMSDGVKHAASFIDHVRRLWVAGLSASLIGREMGVSKNVIIGIAHRNGFPARPSPIKRCA